MNEEEVALGLGWFSIGLGLAELLAPDAIAGWLGLQDKTPLVRAYGARELTAGLGIFERKPSLAFWLWARVGGDALDLATLATGLRPENTRRTNTALAFAMVVGITLLDIWCALKQSEHKR